MIDKIIIVSGVALLMLGFMTQLHHIAESSSEKTLQYADDMNKAMDCAFVGKPIRECSPTLMETNFDNELNETITVLNNITKIQN